MPRMIQQSKTIYGSLYNFFGATAESGTWNMTGTVAQESVCPYGWKLPSTTNSQAILLSNNDRAYAETMYQLPLNYVTSGIYSAKTATVSNPDGGSTASLWLSNSVSNITARDIYIARRPIVTAVDGTGKPVGLAVRCYQ